MKPIRIRRFRDLLWPRLLACVVLFLDKVRIGEINLLTTVIPGRAASFRIRSTVALD